MLFTTTSSLAGRPVADYLGLVSKGLCKAKGTALDEITEAAQRLGADAVIGVNLARPTTEQG